MKNTRDVAYNVSSPHLPHNNCDPSVVLTFNYSTWIKFVHS